MALARTIFPSSVGFGATTWNKNSGGPIRAECSINATPVMDQTGDDLTFSFLAFHSFINGLVLYLHDNDVLSQIYIGQSGALNVTFSVPDNVSPIEGESDVTIPLGIGYVLRFEPVQVFGSVQNIAVYFAIQPNAPIAGAPTVQQIISN